MIDATEGFVASGHGQALLSKGLTNEQVSQGFCDLKIILEACGEAGTRKFAMTELADQVLHEVLDTDALKTFVAAVWGAGAEVQHDPHAWGTPAYAEAWENTREAFAAEGIALGSRADDRRDDGRAAAFCLIFIPVPVH